MKPIRLQLDIPVGSVKMVDPKQAQEAAQKKAQAQSLTQQLDNVNALCTALQNAVAQVEQILHVPPRARLDACDHFLHAPVEPVCWHEQATECVMRTGVIVPVQVRRQPATHVGKVIEALHVEQLLVQVGIEHLHLAIPLLALGGDLVDAHLRE